MGYTGPAGDGGELHQVEEHHHRNVQSGGGRAAVFGVSDGLITNVALILGIAGAHPTAGIVRLAGLAGLIAGAFSMGMGELISMRAHGELLERELRVEKGAIERDADKEREELALIYIRRGFSRRLAEQFAAEAMANPELALETHAREELGFDPGAKGSAGVASIASLASFAVGALVPLLPWLVGSGTAAVLWSIAASGVLAVAIGAALSFFTGKALWFSALRELMLVAVATAVTWGIGHAVGLGSGAPG